jgi:xanthine dehydrogenase accessory factor
MEGFVGGHCATGSVRTAALEVLGSGQSVLLRVLPDAVDVFPETPGATIVVNPCLSGGALEIYLEPQLPAPMLHVVGTSPIAQAVLALAPGLGFETGQAADGGDPTGATAVIVSSHGDETGAVRAALDAGVGFVGVVCSRTRAQSLLDELDLTDAEARRVHTHVGIEIGARTAPELGLSIMAAVVRSIRLDGLEPPGVAIPPSPRQAVDPVCGMTVTIGPDTSRAVVDGVEHWFCNPGCRARFLEMHAS